MQTLNNPTNIFLINTNIIFHRVSFIKYRWISKIWYINSITINRKNFGTPFNSVLFMLSIVKSFEILPKHNIYGFTSELLALNRYIFVALTNKKPLLL